MSSIALPMAYGLPFAGLLLSIALLPMFAARFWEHHQGKIATLWVLAWWIPYALNVDGPHAFHSIVSTALMDFIPFIVMVFGLYTVAGGLFLEGAFAGTPARTTAFLAFGSLLASVIGVSGASIVLVRPLVRGLRERRIKAHSVVFFIFLVCNVGGSLLPVGNPPLFLGVLHGVPFFWTLHTFPPMIFNVLALLAIHYLIDLRAFKKEGSPADTVPATKFGIQGVVNIAFLAVIVAIVGVSGFVNLGDGGFLLLPAGASGEEVKVGWIALCRDLSILCIAWLSLRFTAKDVREANAFSWGPIAELARLFAAIFACLIPLTEILRQGENGSLAWLVRMVHKPAHYFWATGILSSFLDNAPTYLLFFNVAGGGTPAGLQLLLTQTTTLVAISCGAVFMGANTYIGNAPNFLVRNIAEEDGLKMPSFFGYMAWSGAILIPLFLLDTLIFF